MSVTVKIFIYSQRHRLLQICSVVLTMNWP